ncbi:MAG TPA: universal stress protein [Acidimicrobiales bacterium]|nr:universal stress protein [Acidimicrobiales bacterium]
MISGFLVPLDGSTRAEAALGPAGALARRRGVKVELLTVVPSDDDRQALEEYLSEVGERTSLPLAGREVVVGGDPAEVILQRAEGVPGTIVCMGTHGHGMVRRLFLGTVSEVVVRGADRHVLLVGPRCAERLTFGRVTACLDGSSLAERVLAPAAEWAEALGVPLWLVQATGGEMPTSRGDLVESAYLQRTARQVEAEGKVDVEWDVLHGTDPATVITDHVSGSPGSLVALTTHGRSGIQRAVLGSVAMQVAHDATSPLLVLHPRD